jgi:hypothetical protein
MRRSCKFDWRTYWWKGRRKVENAKCSRGSRAPKVRRDHRVRSRELPFRARAYAQMPMVLRQAGCSHSEGSSRARWLLRKGRHTPQARPVRRIIVCRCCAVRFFYVRTKREGAEGMWESSEHGLRLVAAIVGNQWYIHKLWRYAAGDSFGVSSSLNRIIWKKWKSPSVNNTFFGQQRWKKSQQGRRGWEIHR